MQAPLHHANLNQTVYMTLCTQLMRGDYPAGHVLHAHELAERFGTSAMPVREALRKLMAQRALEPMKNRSMRIPEFSRDRLEDIRRVRLLLEGTATEWASQRIDEPTLQRVDQIARQLAQMLEHPDNLAQGLDCNHEFHFAIYQAAGTPTLLALIESLWLQSGPYLRAYRERMHSDLRPVEEFHAAIVAALRQRDAHGARHIMEQDISWPFDQLLANSDLFT